LIVMMAGCVAAVEIVALVAASLHGVLLLLRQHTGTMTGWITRSPSSTLQNLQPRTVKTLKVLCLFIPLYITSVLMNEYFAIVNFVVFTTL